MVFCPFCNTKKPMKPAGKAFGGDGKRHVRFQCTNKPCARYTIHPLNSK
jgi:hypothetical protein